MTRPSELLYGGDDRGKRCRVLISGRETSREVDLSVSKF